MVNECDRWKFAFSLINVVGMSQWRHSNTDNQFSPHFICILDVKATQRRKVTQVSHGRNLLNLQCRLIFGDTIFATATVFDFSSPLLRGKIPSFPFAVFFTLFPLGWKTDILFLKMGVVVVKGEDLLSSTSASIQCVRTSFPIVNVKRIVRVY